jgi:hypothetical protein
MRNQNFLKGYKSFFGLLGFSAIVTEIAVLIERGRFVPSNFFSYFTIQSNLIAAFIFILSALTVQRAKNKDIDLLRGAATFYMVIVGIVFPLLLAGIKGAQFTAVPWDNIVLHYIIPLAALVDWLVDRPTKRIIFSRALNWILFPVAYVIYSLVRGHLVGWYPYPFLNAAEKGYLDVAITSIAISLMSVALVWVMTKISIKPVKNTP